MKLEFVDFRLDEKSQLIIHLKRKGGAFTNKILDTWRAMPGIGEVHTLDAHTVYVVVNHGFWLADDHITRIERVINDLKKA